MIRLVFPDGETIHTDTDRLTREQATSLALLCYSQYPGTPTLPEGRCLWPCTVLELLQQSVFGNLRLAAVRVNTALTYEDQVTQARIDRVTIWARV
jgi:hypothetical protein